MADAEQTPQATHTVVVRAGRVVVSLAGEFDLVTEPDLESWLRQAIVGNPGSEIEVDLHEVTFLDSSGIRSLLRAYDLAVEQGTPFRIVDAKGTVREVLEIVDVYDLLTGAAEQ